MYPQPKPEPRKRTKARTARQARKVVKSVRQQCVERDGYCRVVRDWPDNPRGGSPFYGEIACFGPSQWAHLGEFKRSKTRGKAAVERHTTMGSLMLCARHHDQYDGRSRPYLRIAGSPDGVLRFRWER
jgi:hypothetical protein